MTSPALRMLPQAVLACPYCYERFPRWKVMFRCTGDSAPNGRRCEPEEDVPYRTRFGGNAVLPPVFESPRGRIAKCPRCEVESWVRVCPQCHHRLPADFGRDKSRMIALVGARSSGKTVYLTVLMHELKYKAGDRLEAGMWPGDQETQERFDSAYERRLYRDKEVHDPTQTAAVEDGGMRPPLVFSFGTQSGGGRSLLSFFDTAGEDLNDESKTEQTARYLRSADAVLLILDPLQMPVGRERAGRDAARSGASDESVMTVLQNITNMLKAGRRSSKVKIPLAVAFSKLDLYWDDMPPSSVLHRPESEVPGFDVRDGLEVHDEVQQLLHEWDGQQIDRYLREYYTDFHYFGFSALGATPTANAGIAETGIAPYRVVDPLLWLLSRLGGVRVVGKG